MGNSLDEALKNLIDGALAVFSSRSIDCQKPQGVLIVRGRYESEVESKFKQTPMFREVPIEIAQIGENLRRGWYCIETASYFEKIREG